MEPDTDDDALLVAAVEDPEAFAQFYRRHVRGLLAYFRRRTPDAETAADLTAETFAAALEGCHRYAPERGAAPAWLYGIARRRLIAFERHGRVERGARRRLGMARLELTDDLLERVEAVAADEGVAERQRRRHPAGERREVAARLARIDPDDPVGEPVQPLHLAPDERGVAALPAVGDDHDDGAAG
ncbi:MAG: hypothetical protein QOF04_1161, partial [Solirubrobacteraceae bacterium]|nr:hypothetical protein [Solirubrobacteraceae bacterium]